jgi:hypothetical protein
MTEKAKRPTDKRRAAAVKRGYGSEWERARQELLKYRPPPHKNSRNTSTTRLAP